MKHLISVILLVITISACSEDSSTPVNTVVLTNPEQQAYGEVAFMCLADPYNECQRECIINYTGGNLNSTSTLNQTIPSTTIYGGEQYNITVQTGIYNITSQINLLNCINSLDESDTVFTEFVVADGDYIQLDY